MEALVSRPLTVCRFRRLDGAEIAAPDVKAADAEDAAGEAEERLRIQLHLSGRDAVDLEALADAAGQVAERLRLLVELQRDAVFGERRPQAADVAEQGRALPVAAEDAPRRRAGLALRRRRLRAKERFGGIVGSRRKDGQDDSGSGRRFFVGAGVRTRGVR